MKISHWPITTKNRHNIRGLGFAAVVIGVSLAPVALWEWYVWPNLKNKLEEQDRAKGF